MCVHTGDNSATNTANNREENPHILRNTMKQIEVHLDPKLFIRLHRSIIASKNYI
ncbi:MAG: LytTR family transcriptional regulator [Colwellia sp.]|nr:LytTR family transcriptional regulator [Colwellia sp.]